MGPPNGVESGGMMTAHPLILACGAAWLAVLIGWERAIAVGVTPFITATIIKTILVGFTLPIAWRWVRRLR